MASVNRKYRKEAYSKCDRILIWDTFMGWIAVEAASAKNREKNRRSWAPGDMTAIDLLDRHMADERVRRGRYLARMLGYQEPPELEAEDRRKAAVI